jgi:hypothetical protein
MMIFHLRIEWAVCWAGASSGGSIIPRMVSRLAVAEPGAGEIGGHIAVEPMGKRKQVLIISEAEPNVGKHFQRATLLDAASSPRLPPQPLDLSSPANETPRNRKTSPPHPRNPVRIWPNSADFGGAPTRQLFGVQR